MVGMLVGLNLFIIIRVWVPGEIYDLLLVAVVLQSGVPLAGDLRS